MARIVVLFLAAVAVLLAAAAQGLALNDQFPDSKDVLPGQTQKNDLIRISGTFAVVDFEMDGQKLPQAILNQMKVIQKGADWSFHQGGQVTRGRDTIVVPGQVAHIDSVYTEGGAKVLGIVKVEGDQVRYCWAQSGQPRPTAFSTGPGSGLTAFALRRLPQSRDR
jgi:uncharacterized protein (TIGR03067 family)